MMRDLIGRLHAAELAIYENEPEVAFEALIEAAKEHGDSEQLIDASLELKSHGKQLREGEVSDD